MKKRNNLKILRYIFTALIAYAAYASFFYLTQRSLIFPSEYTQIPDGIAESIPDSQKYWIEYEFGKSESWYFPPTIIQKDKKYPGMIIAHGNADLIDRWVKTANFLNDFGIGILLVEYPGYGRSTGDPTQESITEVFIKAYDNLLKKSEINKNRIILLGQSVGGGAICQLAKNRSSAAVILISTFTSIEIFSGNFLLPSFLVKDSFDNLSVISNYDNPLLLIHGTEDDIIPFEESEKLLNASKNGGLVNLVGGHNLRLNSPAFWNDNIFPFLIKNNLIVN